MSRFKKIRHHVNIKDVKKKHLDKVVARKIKEEIEREEQKYVSSVMKQVKYSWREYDVASELREGMTTANLTITQVPAQGEGEDSLATLDMSVADSFSDNTDRDAPPSGLKDTILTDGGTGTGSQGGFDIGPHVRFHGNSQPRWATLNAVDTSASDTIILSAIRGSDFNGGEIPDLDNEALQLWYYDSPNKAWRPLNQNPLGVTDNTVNHIIIPNLPGELGGGEFPSLRDWTLTLPSWARGPEIKFMFYQSNHSGGGYDHYGLKSVSYRRNTPLTVFAPLDTPEASAFIRMNPIPYNQRRKNLQDRFAPRKQKKNLEKMLEASDKYVATYLGPDFPGMNTEIAPITLRTFEQQSAAMDARDDLVDKIKSLSDVQTERYDNLVSRNISPYHYSSLHDSINELNNFGQSYQNAIDTQNYDEANRLVQNTSKNVIRALGGQLPVFDKSGEVSLAPVTDKYGRTYNPNYELTQEQIAEIDRRYGVTTEAAMRTANESPYNYTLDLGMDSVSEMFDELLSRYDVDEEKLEKGYTYSSVYGDRIYSNRRATVGKETSNKSTGHWTPWYGGKGYKMFRGSDKPSTWDGVGWYPSRVGTQHWQGHRYDGLAYGAFFRIYVGDGLTAREIRAGATESKYKNANGRSDAANLSYYLNFSGSSSYFAERWTETVERKAYVNGKYQSIEPIVIERQKLGTQRDGMTYFHSWYQSINRLREEYGRPPLTNDPFLDALRKEQEENPNFAEPIEQSIDGQIKDENTDPDSLADELTELDDFLANEDIDGFTADELEDMGIMWKGMLNDKPKRDDYDNTRSGAKKFSDDLKAYKQNQEIIAKNTKIIDYHKNTLASIASRDENGKFVPEKYQAMFKEGENSFFINTMDYDFGKINNLLGSASESNPFGTNIGAFDKENTLAYDYSNGVNLGLSSQNLADLFGGGRKIVTAANGKSYARFGDLDYEYKEDANNALNAFMESERDRLYYGGVDFENLSFGDNIFSTQQAFQDHLNLERAKSMNAINLMSLSLNNRLVEVENGFNPVLGSKQDFGAMSDAGVKVSGQSFPPDTNFDLVPVDSEGFFTREFNANLDKPKGSNLTYTQIAQLNGQLNVVVDNGMNRLYKAQARGASEEELGAIAASIWQAEKPISDKLALDYDSMFSPDGKISPTLNSILNNPLSNAIKSLADVVTFDTFDIDNKGRSTNPIVNKINSSVRQLPGDAAMFIRYLTNTGPKVIDNNALGEKRVETMFRNAETKGSGENALNFNDNIAGTTQEPVYKNGKINIAFNYDFEKNATEFQTAKENNAYVESWAGKIMKSITGSDNLGNKILEPLTKAMYNVMGEYSVDAQPSFPVVGTILGPIFGQAIETSKSVGGAKAIPGNVSITPKELYRINPNLYREYVTKGVIPDTERDYYGGYNTGSRIIPYNEAPYFSKDKKKKEDEGTFDVNMNYFPPGFQDAIRTNEIGDTQGQFMPSNPPGMRQQGVGVSANDLSRNQSQAQINAALIKMMDRHDAALRKLKASQLNPNDKKSMDAVNKLVLAQEKERRPLVKALEIKPSQQGEPIFPSAAASTLTTAQSNALLNKGAEVERVADFLNLGATNKELNDLTKDIKVASHTSDKPLPKKLPSFGKLFKASLLGRYLIGNNKQFTEKDLDNAQIQSFYNQTDQILRAGDSRAFGTENGVAVEDLTNQMSDERKKKYGMEPGDKIYAVSSYTGDDVLKPLENNDMIYVLGRYIVITKPFIDAGAPEEKIKEIRDDYDFEYGYNAVRADGGVPGDDTIIGRVKGDETPGTPGTLTKGKGIFGGGIPSEIGIRGAEPISTLAGRSIVNISQGLGVGTPFPIRIKFTEKNWNEKDNYEDDYPVYVKSYESKKPKRGKTLYEKVKKKVFFNPKDIKPEFPKDPPPELDPETGMHPEYGKHVSRYKKLDPHSADAMPDTGDPEIDAEVMKQKSGKKKKKLSDFQRNIK